MKNITERLILANKTKFRLVIDKIFDFMGEMSRKNIGIMSAGIAYYVSLAFFPLSAAAVAIFSMMVSSSRLSDVISHLHTYFPQDIAGLLTAQLQNESGRFEGSILVVITGVILAIISGSGAVSNLIRGLNSAYGEDETRNPVKLKIRSILLTILAMIGGLVVLSLLIVRSSFLVDVGMPDIVVTLLPIVRWAILILFIVVSIGVINRYGVNHSRDLGKFFDYSVLIGSVSWLAVTVLFFIYAQKFAGFSASYSVFAGVIVLMIWLYLGAYAILLGALLQARRNNRASKLKSDKHHKKS